MPKRFAPLVPLACAFILAGCATSPAQQPQPPVPPLESLTAQVEAFEQQIEQRFAELEARQLEELAAGILQRGQQLVGTPYRYGGASVNSGFDCSGFIGYLFREEAGIKLPRSTRQMIDLQAPKVAKAELQPGDIVFFSTRGRGQVSHAGIYIGEQRFIHSASRRSGVRVDSLNSRYWKSRYLQAKRVLTPDNLPPLTLAQLADSGKDSAQ